MRISRLLGAAGRAQARRAVDARVLPRAVAGFYRRALAAAVDERDAITLAAIPDPRELLAVLETARGCDRVIELGRDDPVTPVALALDDRRRRVTAFRPPGRSVLERYAALVEPSTRARIDIRTRPLERTQVSADQPACLAVIDGSSDRGQVVAAFESCRDALEPGGTVAFRRRGDPSYAGVGEAVAALALEGVSAPAGLYLWRKPLQEPPAAAPAPAARRRRRVPAQLLAVAVIGIALGAGVPVVVSELGDGNNSAAPERVAAPNPTNPAEPPPPDPGVPPPARTAPPETQTRLRAGSRRLYRFEGAGPRSLRRFRLRSDAVLHWTSSGGPLEINSRSFQFNASAMRGQTPIPRGNYRGLKVSATGRWSLDIRTR